MSLDLVGKVRYLFAGLGLPLTLNERQIRALKDRHTDERCFIIGNGPSLNNIDLTQLKNEITLGVNAIYTNYENMGFYPTYYIVEDKFVAEDRAAEINLYKSSTKLFGNYLRYCLEADERTILLNVIFNFKDSKDFPHFSTNMARRLWVGGTVSYLCMQIAFYLGCEPVYLIGFDHSYTIPDSAKVDGYDITSTGDDVNHFSPGYFGKGKRWHDPMLDRMEKAYRKALKYYRQHGRTILNATAGGNLELFDRVDYGSLFGEHQGGSGAEKQHV